jgi:hypothetical protein
MADKHNGRSLPVARKSDKDVSRRPVAGSPSAYARLLEEIESRLRTAQIKASLSVNRQLIELYWQIGKSIVERQRDEGWGKSVVERLSKDLQREFPGIAGFSTGCSSLYLRSPGK